MPFARRQTISLNILALTFAVIAALWLAVPSLSAQSCTDTWTGADGNGAWNDGNNWSTHSVPGQNDAACIQLSKAAVMFNANDTIAGLTLGSSDSLTIPSVTNASPSLNISGTSIVNNGSIVLSAPVSFGAVAVTLSNSKTTTLSGKGTFTLNTTSLGTDALGGSALLKNESTINGAGSLDMTVNNTSSGVINGTVPGFQLVFGRNQGQGASTNTGLIEATGGGQLAMGSLTLNNVGGTIMASGTNSQVQLEGEGQGGETFTGGTWTTANGGAIQVVDQSVLLDGTNGNTITNSGTMQWVDGASHPGGFVQGTINNTGIIQVLSQGNGVGIGIPSGQTFTLSGSGNLTMGDGTSNAYNNQPYISGSGIFANQQLLQGTGSINNLGGFTNSGTIDANIPPGTNGLQLVIYRDGTTSNTGTLEATKGGALFIQALAINNKGGSVKAIGKGSYVNLNGMTLSGGKISSSSGGVIYGEQGAVIDGATVGAVTNTASFLIPATGNNQGTSFQGAITNNGTVQILATTGNNIALGVPGGQTATFSGSGSVIMGDGTSNAYNNQNYITGNGSFVNQQIIQGTGAIQNIAGFTNNGTVNANVPTGTNGLQLLIDRIGSTAINTGTMEATNGGTMTLGGAFNNNGGTIAAAGTNSTTDLLGATISGGTLTSSGGAVMNDIGQTLLDGTTNPVVIDGTLSIPAYGNNSGVSMQGTIKNTGTIAVTANSGNTSNGVGVPGGQTFTLTGIGDFVMGDGTNNSYNNNIVLGGSGVLVNQSTIVGTGQIFGQATITNQGTISANVPVGSANLNLSISREGTGGITNASTGLMEAANGGELQISAGNFFTNNGTLEAQVNSTIGIGRITNLSGGTLTGGTYTVAGTLTVPGNINTNAAKITLNGTAAQILNPNTNALAAFATNAAKASFTLSGSANFTSAASFTNDGSLTVSKGSTFTVGGGGTYFQSGTGKTVVNGTVSVPAGEEERREDETASGDFKVTKGFLYGNGGSVLAHVYNSGTVVAGPSLTATGKLTVNPGYIQTASGALDANIASSTKYNVLNVSGTATLGGTLNIGLLNSFVPTVGESFVILSAKSVSGTFATVNGTQINDSEHFTVTYNADNVTLTVESGE
ncbi:MAG TPA: hypothetical protein VF753_11635 [Terriglobales bacterium]